MKYFVSHTQIKLATIEQFIGGDQLNAVFP